MKKTLIAMAIAGVISAPVHAAGHSESPAIGGFGQMGVKSTDAAGTEIIGIFGITASGSTETNGGSTVYGNLSLTSSNAEMAGQNGSNFTVTGAVVGIKGGFGDVFLGNGGSGVHLAQFGGDRQDVSQGNRTRNGIGYQNSFGDLKVRVTTDLSDDNSSATGLQEGVNSMGVQYTVSGITLGAGTEGDDTTIGAKMSFGDIGVAVHSTSWDVAAADGDTGSLGMKLSYSSGDVSASYQAETFGGRSKSQIDAAYSLGGGVSLKLRSRMDDVASGEYTRLMLAMGF